MIPAAFRSVREKGAGPVEKNPQSKRVKSKRRVHVGGSLN
jgi:hypothetical protein